MAITFYNPGSFNPVYIKTMGLSVKSEEAIGQFGTGFKHGIATLLRTGHVITLETAGETHVFGVDYEVIEGKDIGFVTMDGERIGFTTNLGRNWTEVEAYRDLWSNAADEGVKLDGDFGVTDGEIEAETKLVVEGDGIEKAYLERGTIILEGSPIFETACVEVYHGSSPYVFYKGIRAHKLPVNSRYTYNITLHMDLTEDRSFASTYTLDYLLSTGLPNIDDEAFAAALLSGSDTYDQSLQLSLCSEPSPAFERTAKTLAKKTDASENAKRISGRHDEREAREASRQKVDLEDFEATNFLAALDRVQLKFPDVSEADFGFISPSDHTDCVSFDDTENLIKIQTGEFSGDGDRAVRAIILGVCLKASLGDWVKANAEILKQYVKLLIPENTGIST